MKYRVTVIRDVHSETSVEVDAEDGSEAISLVEKMVKHDGLTVPMDKQFVRNDVVRVVKAVPQRTGWSS